MPTWRRLERCLSRRSLSEIPQSIEPLTTDDLEHLERAREWLKGHFTDEADEKYGSVASKLRLIKAILENGWVEVSETWKLQSLGVALGDAIAQELLLEWIAVDDEYGRSAALIWPGTSLICSPLTMISKRIEDGERVEVYDFFASLTKRLKELAFSGDFL